MSLLLELKHISKNFGGLSALSEVSFAVNRGEIFGIIGPNGAGKTTLFNVIAGVLQPEKGRILLEGKDITGLKAHQVAHKGIIQTFQLTTLFMDLSVLQNILIGLHLKSTINPWRILFSRFSIPNDEMEMARSILEVIGLAPFKDRLASELPHGHQRMLGVGVALACDPQIILLDEPVTGMNTDEKRAMGDLINTLHERGLTILLVEHDIRTVMDLCQRIVVLNFGQKIAEGSPNEIRNNQDVIEAYLGPEVA